ncbi:hypothetical protein PAXINDRAFT_100308 [Paxillus involutus ATCC 200175]|uniref:Uncharacterized protein n=1 Tax=Paxillus involutus ATCC 200175 TaxID=664439 RepID=A0A0C9U3K4_PAXIN|nr:hypothetical protein PAXINDRAFT_100308 [Paxillus involutus ATCC 200175]
MTTAPPGFNYPKAYGIESVAGAVIFATLYVPLILFYIRQSFARPTYVYIVLAFCTSSQLIQNHLLVRLGKAVKKLDDIDLDLLLVITIIGRVRPDRLHGNLRVPSVQGGFRVIKKRTSIDLSLTRRVPL